MISYDPWTENGYGAERRESGLDIGAVMDLPGRGEPGLLTAVGNL